MISVFLLRPSFLSLFCFDYFVNILIFKQGEWKKTFSSIYPHQNGITALVPLSKVPRTMSKAQMKVTNYFYRDLWQLGMEDISQYLRELVVHFTLLRLCSYS